MVEDIDLEFSNSQQAIKFMLTVLTCLKLKLKFYTGDFELNGLLIIGPIEH